MSTTPSNPARPWLGASLWVLAFLLMAGAASYQRVTGPTHPLRGSVQCGEETTSRYRLPRSGTSGSPTIVRLPANCELTSASLLWRRYPSQDEFSSVEFRTDTAPWQAELPTQPAAGKVEYEVVLTRTDGARLTIPTQGERPVLRYKNHVPLGALLPHVTMMFLSMLFGMRAALAALLGRTETRWLVPTTAIGLAVGGLLLGPIVQNHAFGAYWTGWPLGNDVTDNKTLGMWAAWMIAAVAVLRGRDVRGRAERAAVIAATLVMLAVYLVPHSMRGSQLDYDALDAGVRAEEAIRTGRSGTTP